MNRLKIAVVGVGHLGKEHARILSHLPEVELVAVVDSNYDQAALIAEKCHCTPYDSYEPLLGNVDAVSIVTPTVHHHEVARSFLESGVPVLVEKPITVTLAQADDLIRLAQAKNVPLQVGHIERFNPAFEALLGRPIVPKLIESERHGPFTGRSTDIGVTLDLMIHDLDLILSLVKSEVRDIEALGSSVFGGHEDIAHARLVFQNGCVANVTASRVSPRPKRKLRVWASEGYAGIDFVTKRLTLVQPSDELRKYGLSALQLDPARREKLKAEVFGKHMQSVDLDCNRVSQGDQLTNELKHFVQCVRTGKRPRVTGEDGRAALALADRIIQALQRHTWTGSPEGPKGPKQLPPATGKLFDPNLERDYLDNREAA